ncbi:uncharacterized protein RCO7_10367 [Rhynchosporium graminicola]|uniref:Uncharacterized protein n=1 Tax=Rhynchosporium graminicola TaxID=2792576 RepID=A0A1E1LSX2_9HELO|nr:uncharacterized protein RCO7_10367 [Rhynchosporium commune]
MSKELAAQACDQCYRCNGSACTWSMGKWLGKPQGTKRKVSDGKEHAETRGQQECRSPGKEPTASRNSSQSRDELFMSEAGRSNSNSDVENPPPAAENKIEENYANTLDCPSDYLQISGESLSSEEDSFLLWPLLDMPPEKLSTPIVDKQPFRPATCTLVSPTTLQHSNNPPDRHPTISSQQARSERAGRQDEEESFTAKSLYSYNGELASTSPRRRKCSDPLRADHTIDLISPPDSSYSWERQDHPEAPETCSESYRSHINKLQGASYNPTNSSRRFFSPLPLLRTENSLGEQSRMFHLEDLRTVQEQMSRSRDRYRGGSQMENDISLVGHPHALIKPLYSRSLQSPQPSCRCLLRILESLGHSDPLLLAWKLLSACEASTRCKSCYNDELALLQRLMGLQKVYTCLNLLQKGCERSSRTRSPKAGLRDGHGDKQAGQASSMEEYSGRGDVELEDRQISPGEEVWDCTLDNAEDVRMLLIRAVTLVSHEEMLSITRRPRVGEVHSVADSILSFGSQFSILLKKFRALLGLESA